MKTGSAIEAIIFHLGWIKTFIQNKLLNVTYCSSFLITNYNLLYVSRFLSGNFHTKLLNYKKNLAQNKDVTVLPEF